MSSDTEKTTLQRLMELKDLYESGLITKEEMEAKKLQILGANNPSDDSSNGEIENEPDDEIPNQAEEDYSPSQFCSPIPNIENEEQLGPENEQGYEENTGPDIEPNIDGRKILKLSLIVAAAVVVLVALAIILTPTNYNKKVAKAVEKYELQDATILSTSGIGRSTKDNHYVIFQKGDTIYVDELERKTPVRPILPREEGFFIKEVFMTFENETPTPSSYLMDEGKKSNLHIRSMLKEQNAYEGERAICLKNMVDGQAYESYYYNMNNPDTIYKVRGDFIERNGLVLAEQYFSFGGLEYVYQIGGRENSLEFYLFVLPAYYNIDDMRFHHIGEYCRFDKEEYPMDLLTKEFSGQNFDYGFPSKWFGTSNLRRFMGCLKRDANRQLYQAYLDQVLSLTVSFDEVCREFNTNPVRAKQLFSKGKRMYISARVDKIKKSSLDGFKYVVFTEDHDENCYFHTNDEAFVNINYPINILVEAEFDRKYEGEDDVIVGLLEVLLFGEIDTRINYIFKNAKLIYYEGYDGSDYYYEGDDYYEEENHQQSNFGSSRFVVIDGSELRLRLGPSTSAGTFKWPDGTNRHPEVGSKYKYLGESGDFYKIDFNGNELWVSKQYTHLE